MKNTFLLLIIAHFPIPVIAQEDFVDYRRIARKYAKGIV